MAANQYPVILYLNQKYALDIMAMMEGGFSQIETQTNTRANQENQSHKVAGGIGLSNFFGLIRMSLDSDSMKAGQQGQTTEVRTEKIHTPNSLFAKMRERLQAESLIRTDDVMGAKTGEFIEFNLTLQKNSLIHAIETITSLLQTAVIFAQPQAVKGKKDHTSKEDSSLGALKQLEKLQEQLNSGDTADLMGIEVRDPQVKIVVTLDRAFLRDSSMSDLIDGEYTILGKVTRVIARDSEASINLLRKTSLGVVQGTVLDQMREAFSTMQDSGIKVPEVVTDVKGPAVQIIPIAIFS